MVWSAAFDPEILPVAALPSLDGGGEALVLKDIAEWLTIVSDPDGSEHILISDGWHHLRLDVVEGRLGDHEAVYLQYRLGGLASAEAMLPPLRRFLGLCRQRRFSSALFPRDRRIGRGLEVLRISDALEQGATQREIAAVIAGEQRIEREWGGDTDSLRSRFRRLISHARNMAGGGYRSLLRKDR